MCYFRNLFIICRKQYFKQNYFSDQGVEFFLKSYSSLSAQSPAIRFEIEYPLFVSTGATITFKEIKAYRSFLKCLKEK